MTLYHHLNIRWRLLYLPRQLDLSRKLQTCAYAFASSAILAFVFGKLLQFGTNSAPQVLAVRNSVEALDFKCQLLHSWS